MALRSADGRDQLDRVASRERWILDEVAKATKDRPFELVWLTDDEETSIHYIEDTVLALNCVLVRGEEVDEVVELIRADVETVPREEVLARGRRAEGTWLVNAAYLVAATASSDYDAEAFAIVERAAEAAEPDARRAAAVSMGYLEWPESRERLERLAHEDPDPDVRQTASTILEALAELWDG
jgi:hypothetical protein